MLVAEIKTRAAETNADIAKQAWITWPFAGYVVWNSKANRVEFYNISPGRGEVFVSEMKISKDGVITYPRVGTTTEQGFTGSRTDKLTDTIWTTSFSGRKDAQGNALDDTEITRKKVVN
jgi:hypothetical protein